MLLRCCFMHSMLSYWGACYIWCICVYVSNNGRGVWDGPRILCGAGHYEGTILISVFEGFFASIGEIFILGGGDWVLSYSSMKFEIFLKFSNFLSLKLFRSFYVLCLLLIITLHFTYGEKKIWSRFIFAVSMRSILYLQPHFYQK